jgi:hypothetical protein
VELIRGAIAAARAKGLVDAPRPVPPALLDRLALPNGEPLPASMRELLAFDGSWLGLAIDEEDAAFVALDLEELIEAELGEDTVPAFDEAYEILSDDCLLLACGDGARRFLYIGNPDSAGEYPVITVADEDAPWVGGFVPFDVWVAQQLGALPEEKTLGWVPDEYHPFVEELARRNGDGRISFEPKINFDEDDEGEGEGDDADDAVKPPSGRRVLN